MSMGDRPTASRVPLIGRIRKAWPLTAWILLAAGLSGCAGSPTFLNPASSISVHEAGLYMVIFYLALGVFVIVETLLVYALIRFRKRDGDSEEPRQVYGNTRLEVIWTAIPVLLVLTLFFLTVTTANAVAPPESADSDVHIHVIGHQWWWEFDYSDYGFSTANELHIPVGANVKIELDSVDVIHSFWVPQMAGKTDAIPGHTNHLWLTADTPGTYHGQCVEFCGANHANMRIMAVAEFGCRLQGLGPGSTGARSTNPKRLKNKPATTTSSSRFAPTATRWVRTSPSTSSHRTTAPANLIQTPTHSKPAGWWDPT